MKKELRNKRRQKQRIMRRVSALDTQDIVQVLLDRGVQLREAQEAEAAQPSGSAGSEAAASSGPEAAEAAPAEPLADALAPMPESMVDEPLAVALVSEPSA